MDLELLHARDNELIRIPIQIESRGQEILGIIDLPLHRAPGSPVILVAYGMNGSRVENHRLLVLLSARADRAGITAVRFDYGGCGLSGGEFRETSIASKVSDTISMIHFLRGCFHEHPFRLFLLGYSDGARVVHDALRHTDGIHGFALWSPVVTSPQRPWRTVKRPAIDPITREPLVPLLGLYMGLDYIREANVDLELSELLAHRVPKCFIFGTGDATTRAAREELKGLVSKRDDSALYEIQGANHLFNRREWSEAVVDRTISWVMEAGKKLDGGEVRPTNSQ
jgi:pimeloyl-ACP methyl ester carboxylesterase